MYSEKGTKLYDVMKHNGSKVGNDIFMVLDYFYASNKRQWNLKPDTCQFLQYKGLHNI